MITCPARTARALASGALLSVASIAVGACTHLKYGFASNPVPATGENLAAGKVLYEANCVSCHGAGARGDGAAAAGLPKPPTDLVVAQRGWSDGVFHIRTIAGAKNGMPSFADTLTEEERWRVIRYVRSLDTTPAADGPRP